VGHAANGAHGARSGRDSPARQLLHAMLRTAAGAPRSSAARTPMGCSPRQAPPGAREYSGLEVLDQVSTELIALQ
jgi:hypothetical protein